MDDSNIVFNDYSDVGTQPDNPNDHKEAVILNNKIINMGPKDFKMESNVYQYDRDWELNLKCFLDDTV